MAFRIRSIALLLCSTAALLAGAPARADATVAPAEPTSLRRVFITDAGMHGVWDPVAFRQLDEQSWQRHFVENAAIEAHIRRGAFVPIYVHSDGGPVIELRVAAAGAPARLSAREQGWVTARSEPYLFVSQGTAKVSGIEYIGGTDAPEAAGLRVPPGRWQAVVHELEWPEKIFDTKTLYPPDFIVTLEPAPEKARFRTSVETFSGTGR